MNPQPLSDKRILLTGATGTLGCETALALARLGAHLLLPVRNRSKASHLQQQLLKACPDATIRFLELDMADEASVLQMSQQLCSKKEPLDAVIHNAGVFTKAGQLSPQGNEWHQQVNAISPLLLTEALLPVLQLAQHPVVVTVTSLSAFWLNPARQQKTISPTKLYAKSKKQLLMSMHRFSNQHPSIRVVYAHPGICATGLFAGTTHQTAYNRHFLKIALPLMNMIFPSPEKACRSTITALLQGQTGHLAEPGGLLHIWGKPKLVPLEKRMNIE